MKHAVKSFNTLYVLDIIQICWKTVDKIIHLSMSIAIQVRLCFVQFYDCGDRALGYDGYHQLF